MHRRTCLTHLGGLGGLSAALLLTPFGLREARAQSTYKAPALGLTLAVPAGLRVAPDGLIPDMQWKLTPAGTFPGGDHNALKVSFDGVDIGRNFIHIVVHDKQSHTEAQLRTANIRPPAVQEMPETKVDGLPGFRYRIGVPASAVIGEHVIVYTQGRQYSFELNAEAPRLARLVAQFDALLKGVSFTR
jgi:hypothetical protein